MKPIGLTLCLSVKMSKGGPSQVMEQDEVHGDGDGLSEDQVLQIRKEEREKQNGLKANI